MEWRAESSAKARMVCAFAGTGHERRYDSQGRFSCRTRFSLSQCLKNVCEGASVLRLTGRLVLSYTDHLTKLTWQRLAVGLD